MRTQIITLLLALWLSTPTSVALGQHLELIPLSQEDLFAPPRVDDHPRFFRDDTFEALFQMVGSGVSVADIDHDGDLDIVLPGGPGVPDRLYRNLLFERGELLFEEEHLPTDERAWRRSVIVTDIDEDGLHDIILHGDAMASDSGSLLLLQRPGGYQTVDLPDTGHIASGVLVTRFTETSEAVIVLLSWSLASQFPGMPLETYFAEPSPSDEPENWLRVLSWSDGEATPNGSHPLKNAGGPLFVAVGLDLDGNDRVDVFISNDEAPNRFLRQTVDGGFPDIARELEVDSNHSDMGVEVADINDDGHLDIFTTQIFNRSPGIAQGDHNRLYINYLNDPEIGSFVDESLVYGVAAADWAWSAYFADLDHDTYLDLLVASGCDEFPRLTGVGEHPVSYTPNYLFRNAGNLSFESVRGTPLDEERNSRVVLPADFDRDGDLDVFELHMYTPGRILLNETEALPPALTLIPGPEAATQGATLWVELEDRTIRRDIIPGRGYLSQAPNEFHVATGFEDDATFNATLDWADGTRTELAELPAAGIFRIVQPHCDASENCSSSPGWTCELLDNADTRCTLSARLELPEQYENGVARAPDQAEDDPDMAEPAIPSSAETGGCSHAPGRAPLRGLATLTLVALCARKVRARTSDRGRPAVKRSSRHYRHVASTRDHTAPYRRTIRHCTQCTCVDSFSEDAHHRRR